jgi:succinate dehydrogenase / fumarate reductase iron-sulfur subunit
MKLKLHVWRQKSRTAAGQMATYQLDGISPDMSFLEMLDTLNEQLIRKGEEPVVFDPRLPGGHLRQLRADDQRLGARPGAGDHRVPVAHAELRRRGGDLHRAVAGRVVPGGEDLVCDRGALDRIIQAGGFVSVNTGGAPDGNTLPVGKVDQDRAMDAAACIGCGACVAACPNASAMLYLSAKVSHLAQLPQGQPERRDRVRAMVAQHDLEGFGHCTNINECEAACPKEISVAHIAQLNRDFITSTVAAAVK